MSTEINTALDNELWVHIQGEKHHLSSIIVKEILWIDDESVVTLEGRLRNASFLLNIQDKSAEFEIMTGKCGDPTDYKSGMSLARMKNLRSFLWWTDNIMSNDEAYVTSLHCQFSCDWVKICE